MIANKMPFAFQTLTEAISAHRSGVQPPLVSSSRPEVPPIIDTLLEQALAKSVEDSDSGTSGAFGPHAKPTADVNTAMFFSYVNSGAAGISYHRPTAGEPAK